MGAAGHDTFSFGSLGAEPSSAEPSPAMPAVFDVAAEAYVPPGTVSPRLLLMQDSTSSAPNSAVLTNLTSPSPTGESPLWTFSPEFDGPALIDLPPRSWFPLFPDPTEPPAAVFDAGMGPDMMSWNVPVPHDEPSEPPVPPRRHSSVAGVAPRSRNKPLRPIVVEDANDAVAMKRARNTLAARKSRERKAQRVEELENEIRRLTTERDYYKALAESRGTSTV